MSEPSTPSPEARAMRLPRPRFTVRGLMAAVAVAGAILGASVMWHRVQQFRRIAREHAVAAQQHAFDVDYEDQRRREIEDERARGYFYNYLQGEPAVIEAMRVWVAHHRSLAAKYELAARYPWLPVAPDPPEPKIAQRLIYRTNGRSAACDAA